MVLHLVVIPVVDKIWEKLTGEIFGG